jgi:hypothetical protein
MFFFKFYYVIFVETIANIGDLNLPTCAYIGWDALDSIRKVDVINVVCVAARKKSEKLVHNAFIQRVETHAMHCHSQLLSINAAITVNINSLKSSPCWTLAATTRLSALEATGRVNFVGEVEGQNLNWGTARGLGALPIRVAVTSVKRVILRIQAKVFLVRCQELVAPREVARVAANDVAAKDASLFTGM